MAECCGGKNVLFYACSGGANVAEVADRAAPVGTVTGWLVGNFVLVG